MIFQNIFSLTTYNASKEPNVSLQLAISEYQRLTYVDLQRLVQYKSNICWGQMTHLTYSRHKSDLWIVYSGSWMVLSLTVVTAIYFLSNLSAGYRSLHSGSPSFSSGCSKQLWWTFCNVLFLPSLIGRDFKIKSSQTTEGSDLRSQ